MYYRGFSLIETVLYIGLLAILVPSFLIVTLGFIQKSEAVDPRVRMEEKAGLILSELQDELITAQSINVSASSFGTDNSSLVYVDESGTTITLARVADLISFIGGDQEVSRLQNHRGTENEWFTDADFEVVAWNVNVVRDSHAVLTGLNILLTLGVLNAEGTLRQNIEMTTNTTIHLEPYTTEL